MMKEILKDKTFIGIVTIPILMTFQIYSFESRLNQRIENTIQRLMPIKPIPDTARIIVAPPMESIGEYYYFIGKTLNDSEKFMDQFNYTPTFPREIMEGYLTPTEAKNGAKYYIWSENKLLKGTEISIWGIKADNHVIEIGYHKKTKDKVYTSIIYPLVGAGQKININP